MATTSVDPAALTAAAARIDDAAELVAAAVRTQLAALSFDGACAGREHRAGGEEVAAGLRRVCADLTAWARAAAALAVALRTGAERYHRAESGAAAALR